MVTIGRSGYTVYTSPFGAQNHDPILRKKKLHMEASQDGGYPKMDGIYWKFRFKSGWWLSPTPLKNDGVRHLG